MTRQLQLPITKNQIESLHAGDEVELSGPLYTGRDQACARLFAMLQENRPLPIDLTGHLIYFVGPTPKPHRASDWLCRSHDERPNESLYPGAAGRRAARCDRQGIPFRRSQSRLRPPSRHLFRRGRWHRGATLHSTLPT